MSPTVKIPVWDLDEDEVIEMEIDQECLDAMDAAHAEAEARREEVHRRERELMRYDRD